MKSDLVRLVVVFLVVGFAACTRTNETISKTAVNEQADVASLQKVVDDILRAVNADDLDAFLGNVTEDLVLLPPLQPTIAGKEMVRAWAGAGFGRRSSDEQWFADEVVIAGKWGFVRGNYALTLTPEGGEPVDQYGKQLLIFERDEGGAWKLARAIWNVTEPPEVTEQEER